MIAAGNESVEAAGNSTYGGGLLFPPYVRAAYILLCVVILGIGVVGNVMVPLVIVKTKDMRNSTNIFLINLSVADLMVLLVCTPTVLVEVNSEPLIWVLGEEMCKAVPFVELTVAHASVLTILAISFERYYAICQPLRAGYVCTKARAMLICLIAWAFAALFTSPIAHITEYSVEKDNNGKPGCYTVPDSFWRKFFFYSILTVFFILPLSILIVLYTVIARHLIRDPGTANSGDNIRARKQVVLMLATVVLSFFLCLLPFRVFTFWVIISPDDITALGEQTYLNLLYFCRLMHYLNSAINPILYNLMSSKFRQGFGRLVGIRRKRHLLLLRHRATFSSTLSRSSTRLPRGSPDLSWRGASLDSRHRNGSIRRSVILRSSLLNHNKQPDPPPQPESYV
ncbi:growth hormone secretagogue receptor type 1-like isoform X2 [Halyomorpha halys]|uniref:growth hormone secretagogue receptor type 1-like isoform X2 n=1 Tax=Halyomorpha halys TaxID=286706 RepID=UPI0006D502C2